MLTELKQLLPKVEAIKYRQKEMSNSLTTIQEQRSRVQTNIETINTAIQYYKKAADILQYQRLDELLVFVNKALTYIFKDEQYEFRIELSDKYTKTLILQLYDKKKDLIKPLRKGNGKGVKAVVCYILYVYFCCELGASVLWQDETLTNISPRYVERLFTYVRNLCETRGIAQVMISQDPRFTKYAHYLYTMDHGNLTMEVNEE